MPARLLLAPDGNAIAVLPVRNTNLGDFAAVLRLSAGETTLRIAYRDSLGQAWEEQTGDAVQFVLPCLVVARELPPRAVVQQISEMANP